MASCQFSLYPLGQQDIGKVIKTAVNILEQTTLQYETGSMSTVVWGETTELFKAMEKIFKAVEEVPVIMTVTYSNACPVPVKKE